MAHGGGGSGSAPIVISLGIETSDANIIASKDKNNDILKKAVAALRELGVPEKEIRTDYLSVEPRWADSNRATFLGYFVRNTIVVTLTDVRKVEELVTRALQAGVNYIHGVDFQTTEFKEHREQARELALKAAKEKADKMAAVLGQSIGEPVQIDEIYGGSLGGYWGSWSGWGYGRGQPMAQNIVQNVPTESRDIGETIALGKISVRAHVAVVFELKK